MTAARKTAHLRMMAALVAVAAPLLVPLSAGFVLRALVPGLAWVAGVLGIVMFLAGTAAFFFFTFRWRPRCPHCRAARAAFMRADDDKEEYLSCASCGYRERTGYTWSDS